MNIEPVVDEQYDQAYGEVKTYRVLEGFTVTNKGTAKTLSSRANAAFRHNEGYLLTVDANIFFNEPSITVETAYEDVDEYGYNHWTFDLFDALEAWLTAHSTLRK